MKCFARVNGPVSGSCCYLFQHLRKLPPNGFREQISKEKENSVFKSTKHSMIVSHLSVSSFLTQ